jgi:hypothetical protein
MGQLTPAVTDRLKKLVAMLSSDKDAEVVSAARAIVRTLSQNGSDIHELVRRVGNEVDASRSAGERRRERTEEAQDERPNWHAMARECQQHAEHLDERERDFVDDMVRWTLRREPSPKQAKWLHSIWCQVGRRR